MTTSTPAEQAFYDALIKADREHVVIVRKTLEAWRAGVIPEPQPQDFGAPVGTPAWTAIEDAANAFDQALGGRDDRVAIDAALKVVNTVLAR
ncbi:MAG: hypothetical protein JWO57_796 [Pseudonocardiales bacterium]|nr:hypothetical protein [Pseudonocardiales bacterium]